MDWSLPTKLRFKLPLICWGFLWSASAFAALGGDVSSISSDQVHINATVHVMQAQGYAVHELRSASGTIVREYIDQSGKVFGIAWQSTALPDLKQLLGSYFDEFRQAAAQAQTHRRARGSLIIQHPGLAVEIGGHMRAFVGRAYLPDQLPGDVHQEQIR